MVKVVASDRLAINQFKKLPSLKHIEFCWFLECSTGAQGPLGLVNFYDYNHLIENNWFFSRKNT